MTEHCSSCRSVETAILILTVSLFSWCAFADPELTPRRIISDVNKYGAKKVVGSLDVGVGEDNDYEKVLEQIATGKKEWLKVAEKLQPGTDASTSEALDVYLAFALPKNPEGVLELTKRKQFDVDDVCRAPFFEDASAEEINSWKKSAIHAVKSISDPSLAKQKKDCLDQLKPRR